MSVHHRVKQLDRFFLTCCATEVLINHLFPPIKHQWAHDMASVLFLLLALGLLPLSLVLGLLLLLLAQGLPFPSLTLDPLLLHLVPVLLLSLHLAPVLLLLHLKLDQSTLSRVADRFAVPPTPTSHPTLSPHPPSECRNCL
jgi:hypothetical protein